ncbi:proteasome regulatory particle base subunit [Physocladia obscura]|uniref:Proteasome regulatory particle base subunit n=1 Tax=Physocladia obscura TaxID=109957 RepID=A0AAD5XCP4_9FUNG|nr:proteasome regulatory particle base subunit [Physocladia obscura]
MRVVAFLLTAVLALCVQAQISIKAVVTGRDGNQVSSARLVLSPLREERKIDCFAKTPSTIVKPITLGEDETLQLSFARSETDDDIVFAHFVHTQKKNVEASFVMEGSKGKYFISIDVSKKNTFIYNQFKSNPGTYTVTFLSTRFQHDLIKVGSVDFAIREVPFVTVLGSTEVFAPQKEIFHVFRKQETMPNVLISYVFTGLVVAVPWIILLGSWNVLGANVSNLSETNTNFVWGVSFLASIAASCVFFLIYWYKLNLFELFGYGSVVWSVLGLLGRQALISHASLRLKAEKKGKAVNN